MIRTGPDYLRGLEAPRNIWVRNQPVSRIVGDSRFRGCINTVAGLYDLQHRTELRDALSFADADSTSRASMSLLVPSSRDDLLRRANAAATRAQHSFGFLGRPPDFVNSAIMAFAAAHEWFTAIDAKFGENVRAYYRYCCDTDPFVAHASIDVPRRRSPAPPVVSDDFGQLRVMRSTSDGLVIRGAKLIATMAPIADELLVFPLPGLAAGDQARSVAFAVPVGTDGVRLICRDRSSSTLGGDTQSPFSASFDEPDALCVFDDVVVPWERVLFYGDVTRGNELWDVTGAREHTAHQGMVTSLAKAELMVGMAIALAEEGGVSEHLHVQEMLGEAIGYLELARGCVARAEAEAGLSSYDVWCPSLGALLALRYHFPTMYRRMIEIVQRIGGASLVIAPNPAEMPDSDVERYFGSPVGGSGVERAALLRLAWEATGDGFGQRQLQFEVYNAGDPVRLAALQYARFPKAQLSKVVNRARGLVARYRVT